MQVLNVHSFGPLVLLCVTTSQSLLSEQTWHVFCIHNFAFSDDRQKAAFYQLLVAQYQIQLVSLFVFKIFAVIILARDNSHIYFLGQDHYQRDRVNKELLCAPSIRTSIQQVKYFCSCIVTGHFIRDSELNQPYNTATEGLRVALFSQMTSGILQY